MISVLGTQICSTVTVAATGTESVYPVLASAPFKNLTILTKPFGDAIAYQVEILFDGDIVSTTNHAAPATREVSIYNVANTLFPANTGLESNPKGPLPGGVGIQVRITNHEVTQQVFEVYAVFEQYEGCSFGKVDQE
jgi:hypothetical protein